SGARVALRHGELVEVGQERERQRVDVGEAAHRAPSCVRSGPEARAAHARIYRSRKPLDSGAWVEGKTRMADEYDEDPHDQDVFASVSASTFKSILVDSAQGITR